MFSRRCWLLAGTFWYFSMCLLTPQKDRLIFYMVVQEKQSKSVKAETVSHLPYFTGQSNSQSQLKFRDKSVEKPFDRQSYKVTLQIGFIRGFVPTIFTNYPSQHHVKNFLVFLVHLKKNRQVVILSFLNISELNNIMSNNIALKIIKLKPQEK